MAFVYIHFERLHVDLAKKGNFNFLVSMNTFSRWADIKSVKCTTAEATINQLENIFTYFGTPERLVSDNGPQFTWEKF